MIMLSWVILVCLIPIFDCDLTYNGFSLLRVKPENESQYKFLKNLGSKFAGYEGAPIDFWKSPNRLNESFDIMTDPNVRKPLLNEMIKLGLSPRIIIDDVGKEILSQKLFTDLEGRSNPDDLFSFFDSYNNLDQIYSYVDLLSKMNPGDSEVEIIGQSTEKRPLLVLKIGTSDNKPLIWLDGGTHAREWIGHSTATYIAYQLANAKQNCRMKESCPADVETLLNTYDFRIQSVINPDGYQYTHSKDRLWRKTRSDSGVIPWSLFCKGTDPNRNYNINWSGPGSSGNPCAQTYSGRKALSEPEVRYQTDFILKNKDRIKMYLSLHSYSQLMLLPYGYTTLKPTDFDELERVANISALAIKNKYGTIYRVGSTAKILYASSGGASDWAYEVAGIKYSYTFELPDTGDKGFLLPPEMIKTVGAETYEGFKAMALNLNNP